MKRDKYERKNDLTKINLKRSTVGINMKAKLQMCSKELTQQARVIQTLYIPKRRTGTTRQSAEPWDILPNSSFVCLRTWATPGNNNNVTNGEYLFLHAQGFV